VKARALSNAQRVILYVSACWVGKTHDYRMLLEEFPPDESWFDEFRVQVDLGFFGIEKDYNCKELSIPHKKPKKKELNAEQKVENKFLAGKRVRVEQALAGLKRYRVLSERLRLNDFKFYDVILGLCAGLWNFYLSC
jgi:hypothetical protein